MDTQLEHNELMDNTLSLIAKTNAAMQEFLLSALKKKQVEGIVCSHGTILFTLFQSKELPMNKLASEIGKSPQTVTTLVQKLVQEGYVVTHRSNTDRRTTIVRITDKGEELQHSLLEVSKELYIKQYQGMSREQIQTFRELLKKVLLNFTEQQR